ncbi:MAG: Thermostable carboxypeptidase 1 [uncultured Thermomicrobiales bacterium]|uniref:Metal-dependent carboxypeptidase n=1 Tax=uncultured Thermomicrobiales bacterium TaxID=1645740 RepID=A0A6J4V243_9BACT|nr:MAG: Thermostable carboxypeptidase 1 [uncultured Thermomicrobiales bacterium]
MSEHPDLGKLKERLGEISDLRGAQSLLGWDQRTIMPQKGAGVRASRIATLGKISHDLFVADETGQLLDSLTELEQSLPFDSDDASLIRVTRRDYEKAKVIPTELTVAFSLAESAGYQAWVEARATSDYTILLPHLERIVELHRQAIALHRAANEEVEDDYDILLDDYEPGLKASEVSRVFDLLKNATIPLVEHIRAKPDAVDDSLVHGDFPVETQRSLVTTLARRLGYTDDAWRLDTTQHPFASSMSTQDIRITTRYYPDFLNPALFGTMHEFGHGLYEHGVSPELERTPLCRGASMAFHESQSRMWENLIGRGRPFWDYGLPELKRAFPDHFAGADEDAIYRAVNKFGPSLIRVEADELTYNLHIIIRFELERDIFSGTVPLADLPAAWNAKVQEYLGIDVPDDAQGVLQDVHWGSGAFGYFPTYALGNVVAAQLWERIARDLPDLDGDVSRGDFGPLRDWLGENIHRHGRKFGPNQLLERVVGVDRFDPQPLVRYLTTKVEGLYGA